MRQFLLVAGLVGALEQVDNPCVFNTNTRPTATPPAPQPYAAPCARVTITRETITAYPYLPDVLEQLKTVLPDDRRWPASGPSLRPEIRRQIASMLDDPNLVFEYSPPQGQQPTSHFLGKPVIAAQTIDGNHIRLSAFAGNGGAYGLARTVLHELVHVHQVRYQGKPVNSMMELAWEVPAYSTEEQLARDVFNFRPPIACGPPPGALAGPVAPAPLPQTGPCRARRNPSSRGNGQYVAWATANGWLRIGPRYQFDTPQKSSEDIWGGRGAEPLRKTLLPFGPWATRDEASEDIVSRISGARIGYYPTASPNNVVEGNVNGATYHLRLSPMTSPDTLLDTGSAYDVHEEMKILLGNGVTPRVVFNAPQTLVHTTARDTTARREPMDQWQLITAKVTNNAFVVGDGNGGTQNFYCDVAIGPHLDSFGLLPTMRQRSVRSVGVWAESRSVELDYSVEPYVDHGTPLCN